MGLRSWLENRAVKAALKKRWKAMNNDKRATIGGVVLAAVMAANIDYSKLIGGDLSQVGLAVGAVVTALLGWLINRPDKTKTQG